MKPKNFFSALSSAQYEMRWRGYWWRIRYSMKQWNTMRWSRKSSLFGFRLDRRTFPLGSWIATPSTETVNSTLGVRWPSALRSCWEKRSLRIPSFTTSIPLGCSTSVFPKNYKWSESQKTYNAVSQRNYKSCFFLIPWLDKQCGRAWEIRVCESSFCCCFCYCCHSWRCLSSEEGLKFSSCC